MALIDHSIECWDAFRSMQSAAHPDDASPFDWEQEGLFSDKLLNPKDRALSNVKSLDHAIATIGTRLTEEALRNGAADFDIERHPLFVAIKQVRGDAVERADALARNYQLK